MTKPKDGFEGAFEKIIHDAERRGEHVPSPEEIELAPTDEDIEEVIEIISDKYGGADKLPIDFAKKAMALLRLKEMPETLFLISAFLKDEISWRLKKSKRKYARLTMARSKCSSKAYLNFYKIFYLKVPDLPRPAEGKIVRLINPKKAVNSKK